MMEFTRLLTADEVRHWYRINLSSEGFGIAIRHHNGTWEHRNVVTHAGLPRIRREATHGMGATMTSDFDHRLTPEGRAGFLAAIDYISLAGHLTLDPTKREVIAGLVRALKRKADAEYLIGRPTEGAQP